MATGDNRASVSAFRSQSIRDQLAKISASKGFFRSERLRSFLGFVIEQSLEDPHGAIKEYRIGTEVYGRPESFNPSSDPIVRVEARRLRAKLKEYYISEGRQDPLEISLPSGTYVPVVRARSGTDGAPATSPEPVLKCITVEPFTVLSAQGNENEFSDGLREEVVHALHIEGVGMRAWRSDWTAEHLPAWNGMGPWPLYAVLQGSIRRREAEIRVSVRLTKTSDGSVIWSHIYSREMRDEFQFAMQENIANAIASAVRETLAQAAGSR